MKANLARIQNGILTATRYNDIALAVLLVAIISLMILPMPTPVVDGLLATNLCIAVSLLMISIYIPGAVSFSAFPSLLLFTTLFRLALNITTTRLILLNADAGKIIYTFGNFVVSGNFVVGAVVFLIITIVQFLVIAKGAERVAEVAARFSLDAMPGKQMSIDADLRSGMIDMETARARRAEIEKESQLYGAMDGAMKFVKGDAIAGLIITAINVIGGISIGVLMKHMPVVKALQTYSILTIGDGLVSQIPALFISITAAVIVTRVTSSDHESNLGGDIASQVLSQPKALLIGGVIIIAFSLVPGFPKPQFIVLGLVVAALGFSLKRVAEETESEGTPATTAITAMSASSQKSSPVKTADGDDFSLTIPLLVDVSASLQESIDADLLDDELVKVRKALYYDLGVPFPGIHLRFNDKLPKYTYTILVYEIPMSQGLLKPGYLFVREKEDNLKIMGIEYETGKKFLPNIPTIWVKENYREQLVKSKISFMELPKVLIFHLSCILKRHADDFIDLQETRYLIDRIEERFPEIAKEVQRILPIQKITEVFQRLVQEEISIRNLRTILQALIEWGQKEKDVVLLTEFVRNSMRRYISYKYSAGQNILAAYLLDADLEETIRKAIRQTSGGSYLALDPATSKKIVQNIKSEVGDISGRPQKPVLLTSMDIRRYVKKLIELEINELPVLSYQELTQEITIQPLSKISL